MIGIASLADELGVSPGDIGVVLDRERHCPIGGLLTDAQAEDVRAVLDPDGVRAAR